MFASTNLLLPRAKAVLSVLLGGVLLMPVLRADPAASEEVRRSDAELNRVYQKALDAMPDPDATAKLRESQRAWLAFRNAELGLLHDGVGAGNTERESHMTEVNKHRAKELQDIIEMTK